MRNTFAISLLLVTLLAAVDGSSARKLSSGVLRYHTEGLNRVNYAPSYGHICNNTKCMHEKRHPIIHPPVVSLDELERRQRVAALHRQYISSQQYRPHPQPFDVRPSRPAHYPQHLAHNMHNGSLYSTARTTDAIAHSNPNRRPPSVRRRRKKHQSVTTNSLQDNQLEVIGQRAVVVTTPRSNIRSASSGRKYDMVHTRVAYEYGVPGLSASLSYRVSPTSPPYPEHRVLSPPACDTHSQRGQTSCRGVSGSDQLNHVSGKDTVRVIRINDTCIRCPRRQLARAPRNQLLARVPRPKLRFCSRPDDSMTDFPLMVLRGPRMGTYVEEGDYTIVFKTLVPLPAKTCRYTLQVYSLRCPPLPPVQHGSFECTNGHLWGSRCHLRCESGFHLRGLSISYGYLLNQQNVTATFKCVKRKRQAIWKTPYFEPICTDKTVFPQTTTEPPVTTSTTTKKHAGTNVAPPKRRVSCRWPKQPTHGWSSCGQRGRWKKRLFVREHLPCFRGCNAGFEPSISLNSADGKKNRVYCVGGSWIGFQEFQCENRQESAWKKCRETAESNANVLCHERNNGMQCQLNCPPGSIVAKRDRPNAAFDCASGDVDNHKWPSCQDAVAPRLVDGCKNQIVENATFPLLVEQPKYVAGSDEAGPVEVNCNLTSIQRYGEYTVSCTAIDLQLGIKSECNFTVVSTATSCKPFEPGAHVVANCAMPSGLLTGIIGYDSLPVGAQCEFTCEKGYTLPTSRLEETYTTCQNDGTWTVTDLDLCKPLENPITKRQCENQTFTVERIPTGGIPLSLPVYLDSLGEDIDPICTHTYATEFGETPVVCEFDDYEIRTRSSCVFYVTVQNSNQQAFPTFNVPPK